jgi:SAM-dependent methyltransferase
MLDDSYQQGFSKTHREVMYNADRRSQKARKVLAVLADYLAEVGKSPADLRLLDIGCSAGFMTRCSAAAFAKVVGVDIDQDAVAFAKANNSSENVVFSVGDSMALDFEDGSLGSCALAGAVTSLPETVLR